MNCQSGDKGMGNWKSSYCPDTRWQSARIEKHCVLKILVKKIRPAAGGKFWGFGRMFYAENLNLLPSDSRRFSIYRSDCYLTVIGFQFTCYRTVDEFQFTIGRSMSFSLLAIGRSTDFNLPAIGRSTTFNLPAIGRSTNFNLLATSFNLPGIGRSTNFNLLAISYNLPPDGRWNFNLPDHTMLTSQINK